MKTIKTISLIFLSLIVFYACNDDDLDVADNAAGFSEGGLIRNDSKLVNYVIGSDATYNFNLLIYQGAIKTTSVDVYKSFTSASGEKSNESLLKTITIDSNETSSASVSTTFTELIAGLSINGQPLTSNDAELVIADFWTLRYVSNTSEGNSHSNGTASKLAVSTRLAGNYTIDLGWYIHPSTAPGLASDYTGDVRIIESVANEPDYATYKMTDIGVWTDDLNLFYFYVSNTADSNGNFPITIPKEWDGAVQLIWGADELANCDDNPGNLPDVLCKNFATLNPDGHDNIFISYGYIRSSGTRQFEEGLTKQ